MSWKELPTGDHNIDSKSTPPFFKLCISVVTYNNARIFHKKISKYHTHHMCSDIPSTIKKLIL